MSNHVTKFYAQVNRALVGEDKKQKRELYAIEKLKNPMPQRHFRRNLSRAHLAHTRPQLWQHDLIEGRTHHHP